MAQTVQILRTTTTAPPAALLPGAFSAVLAPTATKLYIGSPTGNLLLLSSDPADVPIVGQHYIPITGGIISGTSPGTLQITRNQPTPAPAAPAVSALYVVGGNAEQVVMGVDGIGAAPRVFMRRANGIGGALTTLALNDTIGSLSWRGYGATAFGNSVATISAVAAETWSDLAQGANLQFWTTPAGGVSLANNMTLDGAGNLTITRQLNAGSVLVTGTNQGFLQVTRNAIATPLPVGVVSEIYAVGGDGETPVIGLDSYGVNAPQIIVRHANGTGAARTVTVNGDYLGHFAFRGYGGVPDFNLNSARISAVAIGTYSGTSNGSLIQFATTITGTTTSQNVAQISQGLTLGVPGANGADNGGGSLIANMNTAAARPDVGTSVIGQFVGVNGTPSDVVIDGYATNFTSLKLRRANGTGAAPSQVVANDILGAVTFNGFGTTTYNTAAAARIQVQATEAYTDSVNHGAQLLIQTSALASAAATVATFGSGLTLGTPPAVGTDTLRGTLVLNRNVTQPNTTGLPGSSVAMIQAMAEDGQQTLIVNDSYGSANGGQFILRRINGSAAVPSRVNAGELLGSLCWRGYAATVFSGNAGRISAIATENFTDTAQGSFFEFVITLPGSLANYTPMTVSRGVTLGVPSATRGSDNGGGTLILNANNAVVQPAPAPAPVLQMSGVDGSNNVHMMDAYGNTAGLNNLMAFRRARGTAAAPTAIQAGDLISQLNFYGHDGNASYTAIAGAAAINISAASVFTTSSHQSQFAFYTCAAASTSLTNTMTLVAGLLLGAPTGGDKGVGTLNATGVYANNVLLTSDASLKHDIEALPEGCLELVAAIDPKRFRFIEPDPRPPNPEMENSGPTPAGPPGWFDRMRWGFVAQDVEAAMHGHDFGGVEAGEDGLRSLDYNAMIAVLWKAVQELAAERRTH